MIRLLNVERYKRKLIKELIEISLLSANQF